MLQFTTYVLRIPWEKLKEEGGGGRERLPFSAEAHCGLNNNILVVAGLATKSPKHENTRDTYVCISALLLFVLHARIGVFQVLVCVAPRQPRTAGGDF